MNPEIKRRIEQIRRGDVPEEYKKAIVGIIPDSWEPKKLKDICEINPPPKEKGTGTDHLSWNVRR
jgi:restriction endonuclease S subunit